MVTYRCMLPPINRRAGKIKHNKTLSGGPCSRFYTVLFLYLFSFTYYVLCNLVLRVASRRDALNKEPASFPPGLIQISMGVAHSPRPPPWPRNLLRLLLVAASPRPLPWPVRTFATLRPAKVRHDAALHSARETRNTSIWYAPRHVSFHVLPWATHCSTLCVRLAVQFQRIAGRRAGLSVHQVCGDDDGGSVSGHP